MLAIITSGTLQGIEALPVQVEVNPAEGGDPCTFVVGLPDTAVKESVQRVLSAIGNSGRPLQPGRQTVNLAPGDLRKEGPCFDLPMALGLLMAGDRLKAGRIDRYIVAGELSLSGATRDIRGGLAYGLLARRLGKRGVILPPGTAREAALVEGIEAYAVKSLADACLFLEGRLPLEPLPHASPTRPMPGTDAGGIDFSEIKGQPALRRAVEVAVAGFHSIVVLGPPGSGKSMIAKRIPTIMPEPCMEEFLEILAIHSAAGVALDHGLTLARPFRSPHHTISDVGLLGGGSVPGPGEISLAHQGVLFLDELPEFRRSALEVLRQPLEDGTVTISRSAGKVTLPCSFMLVAAMNPCPCGHLGDRKRRCSCTPNQVQRYRARISGPLLDRIDLHCEAPALAMEELRCTAQGEDSATVRSRVRAARAIQAERYRGMGRIRTNAHMTHGLIQRHCALEPSSGRLLQQAMENLGLSARAHDRVLKVARTIADIAGCDRIADTHLLEAIHYRSLDRARPKA